jgi:hypothetical protein
MTGYQLGYILDHLSIDQLVMLYDYGMEFEEIKATIFLNKYGEALSGKRKRPAKSRTGSKPYIKKFDALYGNKIKRGKRNGK